MSSTRLVSLLADCVPMLGVVAFIAGALWAGILFSVSWLSGRARWMADGTEIGSLAISLNRRWATPCLAVCLMSACLWIYSLPRGLLPESSILGLGMALVVLLLVHSNVAVRASRVAHGSVSATRREGLRRFFLVVSLTVLTAVLGLRLVWPQ
jgi:hypothetical protein